MKKICLNCFYFRKDILGSYGYPILADETGNDGKCTGPGIIRYGYYDSYPDDVEDKLVWLDSEDYDVIHIGKYFGCVHWKSRK